MRLLIASLLALAMMPAMADFSFRFGDGVVNTGDRPGTIVRKAGRKPDRIVQLENRHGAAVGERWELGRAHVWTPVTNAHLVCNLLLAKKTAISIKKH